MDKGSSRALVSKNVKIILVFLVKIANKIKLIREHRIKKEKIKL